MCQAGEKEEGNEKRNCMIVKMKEILLFTTTQAVDNTICQLGQLGVVDIKEVKHPENSTLERRKELVHRAEGAITLLRAFSTKEKNTSRKRKYTVKDPKQLVDRVLQTRDIKQKCKTRLEELTQQLAWYTIWGKAVNTKDLHYLSEKGMYLRLYILEKSSIPELKTTHTLVELSEQNGKIPVVLVSQDPEEKLDHKEETPPRLPYEEIPRQIERKKRQLNEVVYFLEDQSKNTKGLQDYVLLLKDRLNRYQALEHMGDIEGKLKYLKGYIPGYAVSDFVRVAEKNNWGVHIADPEKPEEVPVYIKNPKWISIINPVMQFIDLIPGYKEVDVSIYFLVAFALFFAMLVGDAGYGFLFLLTAVCFRKRMHPQLRVLIFVLSGVTVLWGVLSGTYFGAEQIARLPFLRDLVIPEIASFGVDNIPFMMHLSFLIGAFHLTVAHGVRVVQFSNSIRAWSEVGWILLVWGLFFLTEQLVLGKRFPDWGLALFIGGALMVALFSVESKNFFKSMGISIANLPLSLISGFSDIVSYVRLFAVGMATAAVAASFNTMILPEGASGMGFLKLAMAAVALILGHGLNIALALMAVMVHGLRLNMLEFAGHLGVQFSGEAYKPFKLISSDIEIDEQQPLGTTV